VEEREIASRFPLGAWDFTVLNITQIGCGAIHAVCSVSTPPYVRVVYTGEFQLLTPGSKVLLDKLTGPHLFKGFSVFYGTRKFITALASAFHPPLNWARLVQSILHKTYWRSTLILYFYLHLRFPKGIYPSRFTIKPRMYLSPPYPCYIPHLYHSSGFDHTCNSWAARTIQLRVT